LQVCWHRWCKNRLEELIITRDKVRGMDIPCCIVHNPAIIPSGEPRFWNGPWHDTTHPISTTRNCYFTAWKCSTYNNIVSQIKYFYYTYSGQVIINTIAIGGGSNAYQTLTLSPCGTSEPRYTYQFSGETITATYTAKGMEPITDTFDFSALPDGEAQVELIETICRESYPVSETCSR